MAEPKKKPPKKASKTKAATDADPVLYVRITRELDADLDAWVEALKIQHPGFSLSKSDLVRDVLIRAVRDQKTQSQGQ